MRLCYHYCYIYIVLYVTQILFTSVRLNYTYISKMRLLNSTYHSRSLQTYNHRRRAAGRRHRHTRNDSHHPRYGTFGTTPPHTGMCCGRSGRRTASPPRPHHGDPRPWLAEPFSSGHYMDDVILPRHHDTSGVGEGAMYRTRRAGGGLVRRGAVLNWPISRIGSQRLAVRRRSRSCSRTRKRGREARRAARAPGGPAPPALGRRTAVGRAAPGGGGCAATAPPTGTSHAEGWRRARARRAPGAARGAQGRARGERGRAARPSAARPRTGSAAAASLAPRWSPGGAAGWACRGWTCARGGRSRQGFNRASSSERSLSLSYGLRTEG